MNQPVLAQEIRSTYSLTARICWNSELEAKSELPLRFPLGDLAGSLGVKKAVFFDKGASLGRQEKGPWTSHRKTASEVAIVLWG